MTTAKMKELANGAKVIIQHHDNVLAYWNHSNWPWVTWRVDSNGNAYWGHYFANKADALIDFMDRTGLAK